MSPSMALPQRRRREGADWGRPNVCMFPAQGPALRLLAFASTERGELSWGAVHTASNPPSPRGANALS